MKLQSTQLRVSIGRITFFILVSIFTLSVTLQFFFAGMAIFLHAANWMKHTMFVHLFGFTLPVLLLIFAFIGKLPRWAYWQIFGLFTGIYLMYLTANIRGILPWIGTLHPIIGLFLFLLSIFMLIQSWKFIFKQRNEVLK